MARLERVEQLGAACKAQLAKALPPGGRRASVVVGYTAAYALYVHENLEARHPNGQARFLVEPLRRLEGRIAAGLADDVRAGLRLDQALLRQGLYLQAESQRLVPVDTGALKASAFTRAE